MVYDKKEYGIWTRAIVITIFVAIIFYFARSLFVPLMLSGLLAFVLSPAVDRLERMRLGRMFSVFFVTAAASGTLALFVWLMTNQALEVAARIPEYKANLIQRAKDLRASSPFAFKGVGETISELSGEMVGEDKQNRPSTSLPNSTLAQDAIKVDVVSMPDSSMEYITGWLGTAFHPVATFGLVFMLTVFILLEREDISSRVVQLFAASNLGIATKAVRETAEGIGKWLKTMMVINALYGIVIAVGLYFIDLPSPLAWGMFAFACRFLPYIGPWIGALLPFLLSLAVFKGWGGPLMVLGLFAVMELVVNWILEPWLYGKSVGLSPLGIVLAVVFWAWIWGLAGILMAIPITLTLVILGRHFPEMSFFAVLFGDKASIPGFQPLYQSLLAFEGERASVITDKLFQSKGLNVAFEKTIVPMLHKAEFDRRAGAITEEQLDFIYEGVETAIETAPNPDISEVQADAEATENAAKSDVDPEPQRRILIVPVSSRGDEISARVLAQIGVKLDHIEFEIASGSLLVNEIIERIKQGEYGAVIVTGMSEFTASKARLLAKRIRQQFLRLPVFAANWVSTAGSDPPGDAVERAVQVIESVDDALRVLGDIRHAAPQPATPRQPHTPPAQVASPR